MNNRDFLKKKAQEWVNKGSSDARSAKILVQDINPPADSVCFHCQQAVEKHLKGYLTLKSIEFIKSHDLDYLLKLSIDNDGEFNNLKEAVFGLNKYSIEPRYPADIPIYYSIEEARKAINLAEEAVGFIKRKIEAVGGEAK